MNPLRRTMTFYMAGSIVFVSAGGYLLHSNSLVPAMLTYATFGAVAAVAVDAVFVATGSRIALNVGVILSLAAVVSSLSSPAHLAAMLKIFDGGLITALDILEIIGFYVFPLLYIGSRFLVRKDRLREAFP